MPWCPVCKNEYVDGITMCADCNVPLVDTLEENKPQPVTFGTEDEIHQMNEFLKYNKVTSGSVEYDETEEVYELYVSSEDLLKAKKIIGIFKQEEAFRKKEEEQLGTTDVEAELEEKLEKVTSNTNAGMSTVNGTGTVYEKKSDKAENFKSSAYTLVGVGVFGAVLLILCKLGVIPFQLGMLTYIVMGILFAVFIIMGISSYRSYKRYANDAREEDELKSEVEQWCKDHLTKETIDVGMFAEDVTDEMKYFKRMGKMKQTVQETYMNLDEGFLDSILEELYPSLFE